jgi:hypothetical protein
MQRPVTRAVERFQETLPSCGAVCIFRCYVKPVSNYDHRGAAPGVICTDHFVP